MSLRVGVIGTGIMGADHVHRLANRISGADVVALSDANAERAAKVAGDVGCRVHADPLDVILDDEVDAVVVASPDETHEQFVLACIREVKPVLCEKPLAATADACLRIVEAEVDAVQAGGRQVVQVGFMRRFDPGYREVKRLLDSGALGAALLLHCQHRNEQSPPWFDSGMPIVSSAIHEIDVVRWLLGEEIVAATVHRPRASSAAPAGMADPQLLLLRTQSGVLADVEVFVNARYGYDIRCELVGESGTATLQPPSPVTTRTSRTEGQPIPSDWIARFAAAYELELQTWVDGVRAGRVPGPTAWDGYAASAVADACIKSLQGGQETTVSLAPRPPLYGR